jgi:hypothetical protein
MHLFRLIIPLLLSTVWACAQTATFTADRSKLATTGGQVNFTATITYTNAPDALGFSVQLPSGWSIVRTTGTVPPQVAPAAGATTPLEWAYTTIPVGHAQFYIAVRYPAGVKTASVIPSVICRTNGRLTTLSPPPVNLVANKTH